MQKELKRESIIYQKILSNVKMSSSSLQNSPQQLTVAEALLRETCIFSNVCWQIIAEAILS